MNKNLLIPFVFLFILLLTISGCEQYVGRNVDAKQKINDNLKQEKFNPNIVDKNNKEQINFDKFSLNRRNEFIKNKFLYLLKFTSENQETQIYYKEKKIKNAPRRDRQREEDNEVIRGDYFDVNLIFDEDNEWVRDSRVSVFIYYEGINLDDSFLYSEGYQEDNIRINLIGREGNVIPRNDNFDVVLILNEHHPNRNNEAIFNRVFMIKPLLPRNHGILTFNLSEAQIINTNLFDIVDERDLAIKEDVIALRINQTHGLLLFYNAGFNFREINNKIYVSEDVLNIDWKFIINNYFAPEDLTENPQTHMDLTINDIIYPVNDSYDFDENNLRQIIINLNNPFIVGLINSLSWNFMVMDRALPFLPIRINYFFTQNSFFNKIGVVYYLNDEPSNVFDFVIPFVDYYEHHEEGNIINFNPISLKLTTEFYKAPLYGYLVDYNNFNISYEYVYPLGYTFNQNLQRGSVRIVNPQRNVYYSTARGSNFYVSCDENPYFPNMECVEGDYIINWSFTNIIKNRNLYLDAVVHYDGERWSIIQQNSKKVDRTGGKPMKRLELG